VHTHMNSLHKNILHVHETYMKVQCTHALSHMFFFGGVIYISTKCRDGSLLLLLLLLVLLLLVVVVVDDDVGAPARSTKCRDGSLLLLLLLVLLLVVVVVVDDDVGAPASWPFTAAAPPTHWRLATDTLFEIKVDSNRAEAEDQWVPVLDTDTLEAVLGFAPSVDVGCVFT